MAFLKNNIKNVIFYSLLAYLLLHINQVTLYTKKALIQWYESILPSQFVTIVLLGFLKESQSRMPSGSRFLTILKLIFCGLVFGFPSGAILVGNAYKNHQISRCDANILLPVCNLFGPAYLFGFVYPTYQNSFLYAFTKSQFLFVLYGIPLLYLLILYVICRLFQLGRAHNKSALKAVTDAGKPSVKPIQKSFPEIITDSLITVSKLAGFMMFFSGLQFVTDTLPLSPKQKLFGKALFEISSALESVGNQYPIASVFFIIFGCLSGIAQTYCILYHNKLSIIPYALQKILLGLLAVAYLSICTQ